MKPISKLIRLEFNSNEYQLGYKEDDKVYNNCVKLYFNKEGSKRFHKNNFKYLPRIVALKLDDGFRPSTHYHKLPISKIILRGDENDYEIDTQLLKNLFLKNKIKLGPLDVNCWSCKTKSILGRKIEPTICYLERLVVYYIYSDETSAVR